MTPGKPGAAAKLLQAATLTTTVINRYRPHLHWSQEATIRAATHALLKVAAELHGAKPEQPKQASEQTEQQETP